MALAQTPPALRLPSGAAVATSGIWTQSYTQSDRVYSHIIDPGARSPISGALRSVTVLSDTATTADGWATALCAAGADAGPTLASSMGISALFIVETARGLGQIATGAIREVLL
jgi:thiamine biosynthesis lipoprotein